MITLRLSRDTEPSRTSVYRVADRLLVSDEEVELLRPFSVPDRSPDTEPPLPNAELLNLSTRSIYQGQTEIAGRPCAVECWSGPQGYRLRFGNGEAFGVTPDGSYVGRLSPERKSSDTEDFLEPPLILALALQRVFCLHAGAVEIDGQAVAFLGDSGAGKSTLAAFLSRDSSGPVHRLADNLLPVEVEADGVIALPSFPQRKLNHGAAYSGALRRLPLTAIYLIDQLADDPLEKDIVRIGRVGPANAALTLVRHTVATRLLDDAALARHMAFCVQIADQVTVQRLLYPRVRETLPRVEDEVRRNISSLAG